jgi:hypothetical protein
MYILLLIALVVILPTWFSLRRYTRIWVNRPIRLGESIIAGVAAWLFLLAFLLWFAGICLTLWEFLTTPDSIDIWALILAVLITGYGIDFGSRARSAMNLSDTMDFLKEAIQFRRSAQHRLDVLALIQMRRMKSLNKITAEDPESIQRIRLQATLEKGRDIEDQLTMLREGSIVDLTDMWRTYAKENTLTQFYERIKETKVDPQKKRLSINADFPEFTEEQLRDEMVVLRLNRQLYDFFQSLKTEPWLRPYLPFIESFFTLCRATQVNPEGISMLYPFMKVGILVSDLNKIEGTYFNPRRLSEIAAVAFNNGERV